MGLKSAIIKIASKMRFCSPSDNASTSYSPRRSYTAAYTNYFRRPYNAASTSYTPQHPSNVSSTSSTPQHTRPIASGSGSNVASASPALRLSKRSRPTAAGSTQQHSVLGAGTPVAGTPVAVTPANGTPSNETAIDDAPVNETTTNVTTINETPADDTNVVQAGLSYRINITSEELQERYGETITRLEEVLEHKLHEPKGSRSSNNIFPIIEVLFAIAENSIRLHKIPNSELFGLYTRELREFKKFFENYGNRAILASDIRSSTITGEQSKDLPLDKDKSDN
ncbi:hypothetical protein HPULCUR_009247 [Helicostylum pulchrum]|uniref:Uncharacterized protein n=1 Tax=Helicostylum pulchrum TaxID=562976 RepID=A0ABP9YA42_9FUNG